MNHYTNCGYEVIGTGGGCQAYFRQYGSAYALITDDDGNLPTYGEPIVVGVYTDADCGAYGSSEPVYWTTVMNDHDAVADADWNLERAAAGAFDAVSA